MSSWTITDTTHTRHSLGYHKSVEEFGPSNNGNNLTVQTSNAISLVILAEVPCKVNFAVRANPKKRYLMKRKYRCSLAAAA